LDDGIAVKFNMSFGFGFGDFVTLIQLAQAVREQFIEAPKQYKALSDA
jgi:hypothetical protein